MNPSSGEINSLACSPNKKNAFNLSLFFDDYLLTFTIRISGYRGLVVILINPSQFYSIYLSS
jgi:hypothetical protein